MITECNPSPNRSFAALLKILHKAFRDVPCHQLARCQRAQGGAEHTKSSSHWALARADAVRKGTAPVAKAPGGASASTSSPASPRCSSQLGTLLPPPLRPYIDTFDSWKGRRGGIMECGSFCTSDMLLQGKGQTQGHGQVLLRRELRVEYVRILKQASLIAWRCPAGRPDPAAPPRLRNALPDGRAATPIGPIAPECPE